MTDKSKTYNLTPEHFARARANVARRRAEVNAKFDLELADIDAWDRNAADFAERYPETAASPKATKNAASPAATKGRKARRSNAGKRPNDGKPYTPEQDARIIASVRGERAQLAREFGHPYEGLLKHHEVLVRQRREAEKIDAPTPDQVARRFDESLEELAVAADIGPSSSENPEIVEPIPAGRDSAGARELAEFDGRLQRRPQTKPGVPVPGLTDDGPGKERFLDPVAFASMRPD